MVGQRAISTSSQYYFLRDGDSWMRLVTPVLVLALTTMPLALRAETHHFIPKQFYTTFSGAHPPALRIKPGDRVITKTIDAGGSDWEGKTVSDRGNPETGPFYIEGAEPGDVIVVTFEKMETNRTTAFSGSLLAPYTVDPAAIAERVDREPRRVTWNIDKAAGVAHLADADIQPGGITFPLKPMLGCVAVAPERKQAIATSTPGNYGGNMDYAGMNAGVKLTLPVFELGALLFIGDGHARQGEGEVVGSGLETSMDVEFTVALVKQKKIAWPHLENDTHIMVLGSARPVGEALQHATSELQRWLMADYGFTERGAQTFMGQATEYEIANVVDPNFTVVAKIRKSMLPRR
jgi:acetamidase/formamidase